jgi:hypothetical protein
VIVSSLDAPIVGIGPPWPFPTRNSEQVEGAPDFSYNLYNNIWGTNYSTWNRTLCAEQHVVCPIVSTWFFLTPSRPPRPPSPPPLALSLPPPLVLAQSIRSNVVSVHQQRGQHSIPLHNGVRVKRVPRAAVGWLGCTMPSRGGWLHAAACNSDGLSSGRRLHTRIAHR